MLEDYDVSKLLDGDGNFRYKDSVIEELPTQSQFVRNLDRDRSKMTQMLNKYYNMNMDKLRNNKNSQNTSINEKAKYLMDRAIAELGITPEQAAGLAGNIMQESGFNPKAVGDGGKAHGIAQWHPSRRKNIDMLNTSFEDQVTYLIEELKGAEIGALRRLRLTGDSAQAASIIDQYYERSNGKSRKSRIQHASNFLKLFGE